MSFHLTSSGFLMKKAPHMPRKFGCLCVHAPVSPTTNDVHPEKRVEKTTGSKRLLIFLNHRNAAQDLPAHADDLCTGQRGIKNTAFGGGMHNTLSSFNSSLTS